MNYMHQSTKHSTQMKASGQQ